MNYDCCYMCQHFRLDADNIFNGTKGVCLLTDRVVYINNICHTFESFIIEEKKNVNPS